MYGNYVCEIYVYNVLKTEGPAGQQLRSEAQDHGWFDDARFGNKTRSVIKAVSVSSIEPDIFLRLGQSW